MLYIKDDQLYYSKTNEKNDNDYKFEDIHREYLGHFAPSWFCGTTCTKCDKINWGLNGNYVVYNVELSFADALAHRDTIVRFVVCSYNLNILRYEVLQSDKHMTNDMTDYFRDVFTFEEEMEQSSRQTGSSLENQKEEEAKTEKKAKIMITPTRRSKRIEEAKARAKINL